MAYRFTGFFIRVDTIGRAGLGPADTVRPIDDGVFCGIGINLAGPLSAEAAQAFVTRMDVGAADWMYIDYATWAGPVDHVDAFGQRNGALFSDTGDGDDAEDAFKSIMAHFGIRLNDRGYFQPFERGYWD